MHDTPPTLDDIARLAREAWDVLPPTVRKLAGDVEFVVQELVDDDLLDDEEHPLDVTGMYVGPDLTERTVEAPQPPSRIFLYREAILFEWIQSVDIGLSDLVAHVLIHEVGHHFGISDDQIDELLEEGDD